MSDRSVNELRQRILGIVGPPDTGTLERSADREATDAIDLIRDTPLSTPLVTDAPGDPTRQRVLFIWDAVDASPDGVYLWVNRLTDGQHSATGMMRPIPGTTLWFAELVVPRTTMASYRFYPFTNSDPGVVDGRVEYSRDVVRRAIADPHNVLVRQGSPFGSVFRTADAPALGIWTSPCASVAVEKIGITAAGDLLPCRLALPPTTRTTGESPMTDTDPPTLLLVFDADKWFDRFRLPQVLADLHARGRTARRFAIIGVDSPTNAADRLNLLGGNHAVIEAVVNELIPAAGRLLPQPPDRTIVAGQSLGGLAALTLAAWYPEGVDEVLAYSPSVWWRPGLRSRPADVSAHEPWIGEQLHASAARLPRLRLAAGRFEEQLAPNVADLAVQIATDTEVPVTLRSYAGGHDDCWWAAMLLEDLSTTDATQQID